VTADPFQELYPTPHTLLFYDIETAPKTSYLWDLRVNGYVGKHMLLTDVFILSWAAKGSDRTKVQSNVLTPTEVKAQDDSRIVKTLSRELRRVDYTIAHNGDRFDLPIVNARIAANNLTPLGHIQTIDTVKVSRASFGKGIASHSLDYLAQFFGFGHKIETTFELWDQCYRGHGPSLKQMVEYNRHDVVLLEQVFHAMKPYAKKLPRLVEFTEYRQEACPFCGSADRTKSKVAKQTAVNTYPKYRCKSCQREYRDWQAIGTRKGGAIPL
jgi:hypothetical protein